MTETVNEASTKKQLLDYYNAKAIIAGERPRKQFETKEQAWAAIRNLPNGTVSTEDAFGDTADEETRKKINAAEEDRVIDQRLPGVKAVKAVAVNPDPAPAPAAAKTTSGGPREGTDRHRVLSLADGTRTIAQIAEQLGKERKWVSVVLTCMRRDYGTKYEIAADGKVKVTAVRG
jgi:hypothetical protein